MKTAEWVSPKHPDKICDQISDAILDYCLSQDPKSRVAVECMGGHGKVVVMGEVTFGGILDDSDIYKIVKRLTGYAKSKVTINIVKQSPEIANGVDTGGAGDQGIMVGYACNDNEQMIPQEKYLADSLGEYIFEDFPYDGKTQITISNDIVTKNKLVTTVVASFQNVSSEILKEMIDSWIIEKNIQIKDGYTVHANPAGDWAQGGLDADTGLTGRKLMVDNYGPQVSIGGGAFSGKDATKVDRSGAYMARKIAVDMLRELPDAEQVGVKLAYAIGVANPVMQTATVQYKGGDGVTLIIPEGKYDLTPNGIIKFLKLREPIFENTARGGHFGKGFIWDK